MIEALGFRPAAPEVTLPKQDQVLLGYDTTEATRHFDVTHQMGRRERKREATKYGSAKAAAETATP
jgi:hypothetical protein